jgi:ribosomal protein S27E
MIVMEVMKMNEREHAMAIKPAGCSHKTVILFGNEEANLRHAECGQCGQMMSRKIVGDNYQYFAVEDAENT